MLNSINTSKVHRGPNDVRNSANYIVDQCVDVAVSARETQAAANLLFEIIRATNNTKNKWITNHQLCSDSLFGLKKNIIPSNNTSSSLTSDLASLNICTDTDAQSIAVTSHQLHPPCLECNTCQIDSVDLLYFIFTLDTLNFCFWSDISTPPTQRYCVEWANRKWFGYYALVAALQRALAEGIPITSPSYWSSDKTSDHDLMLVFRSANSTEMPLLEQRILCLREAYQVLSSNFDSDLLILLNKANGSACQLVNLLGQWFPSFRDECTYLPRESPSSDLSDFIDSTDNNNPDSFLNEIFSRSETYTNEVPLYFMKRAQIFVADLWAAFDGKDWGQFNDIDELTCFADYRLPQVLFNLGCLTYSPPLERIIRQGDEIPSGSWYEIQIRGSTIWCVEQMLNCIKMKLHETSINSTNNEQTAKCQQINCARLDFILYDLSKQLERFHQRVNDGLVNSSSDELASIILETNSSWDYKMEATNTPGDNSTQQPTPGCESKHAFHEKCKELLEPFLKFRPIPHHRTRTIFY